MKKLIILILSTICWFWSKFYTYNFSLWLKDKRDMLYTLWIKIFLGDVGEGVLFKKPLILQGGGQQNIKIGAHSKICSNTILGCWKYYGTGETHNPEIKIGKNCSVGEYCHFTAINKITIGDGLLTGRFVYIGDNAHGGLSVEEADIHPVDRKLTSKGEVVIGNNVWLGDRVSVFSGVKIGDNVIIGAGSIVTHDIPSNSLAVGSPAKVIKTITKQ